jgi:hypothetical protein
MGTLARWKNPFAVGMRERVLKTMLNRSFFQKGLEKDLAVEL